MMTKNHDSTNKEPGFDSIPDPGGGRPAPTDMINDTVGKIMDNIQKEATGHSPDPHTHSSKSQP